MVLRPDRIRLDNERRRQAWLQARTDTEPSSSQSGEQQVATAPSRAGRGLRSFQQADTLSERIAPHPYPHLSSQPGALQPSTSQACPACRRSMADAALAPCILFPCGHSLCTQCAHRGLAACPSCGQPIANHAPNMALQHLLQANESIRGVAKASVQMLQARAKPPPPPPPTAAASTPCSSARSEQQRVSRDLEHKGTRLQMLQGELHAAQRRQASLAAAAATEADALRELRDVEAATLQQLEALRERLVHVAKQRAGKEAAAAQLRAELAESGEEVARLQGDLPALETEVDKLRFLLQGIGEMALEG